MNVFRRIIREEISTLFNKIDTDDIENDEDSSEDSLKSHIEDITVKKRIRVSCAGLASINIDGKYLLVQNNSARKRGELIYGPLGGALEYLPSAEAFLSDLGAEKERSTPDLRLYINLEDLEVFAKWFNSTSDREKSVKREVYEELVLEEKVISSMSESDMSEIKTKSIRDRAVRLGVESERFFEIFKIKFNQDVESELIKIANDPKSTISLFTADEIMSRSNNISYHSKFIL